MANTLDATGLTINSLQEIITNLENGLKNIYGDDIIIDSNSPDGQLINLFSQSIRDLLELLQNIYNNFDPDQAEGVVLDQRVSINNIQRQGGTFTLQEIDITADRNLNLEGLDEEANSIDGTGYTVADDSGNEFILLDSVSISSGTTTLIFRSAEIGAVETIANTITNPVTVVIGVTDINNPNPALELGIDQETDANLRVRREQSVANSANGYLNGLLGLVLNIENVTDAVLYENVTNIIDSNGIPAHGIWLIVEGGANSDIADAIYERKSYGSNMKGSVVIEITTVSNGIFLAKFDRPSSKNLYLRFDIQETIEGQLFDEDAIKDYIINNKTYNIGDIAETSSLTAIAAAAINNTSGGGVPLNMEISSDGINYFDFLEVDTLDEKWLLDTTRINITIL